MSHGDSVGEELPRGRRKAITIVFRTAEATPGERRVRAPFVSAPRRQPLSLPRLFSVVYSLQ